MAIIETCAKCGKSIDKSAADKTWSRITIYPKGEKKYIKHLCDECTPNV